MIRTLLKAYYYPDTVWLSMSEREKLFDIGFNSKLTIFRLATLVSETYGAPNTEVYINNLPDGEILAVRCNSKGKMMLWKLFDRFNRPIGSVPVFIKDEPEWIRLYEIEHLTLKEADPDFYQKYAFLM